MKTLYETSTGPQVLFLQKLLTNLDPAIVPSGILDAQTTLLVKAFQRNNGLASDGIIGAKTWRQLLAKYYSFNFGSRDYFLNEHEYMKDVHIKRSIYLHHTAGRYRPDYTIQGWNSDASPGKRNRVGTAFVIGGKGFNGDRTYEGKVFRAFNEVYWAHHLGLKVPQNDRLNQESIAIEICSLGALTKTADGRYRAAAYPKIPIYVPESEVCTLETPWRDYQYFQRYTERQIDECKRLILTLAFLFDIQLPHATYDRSWFELKQDALNGAPGLWTHVHVRPDKTDCFPQPEFVEMLNSLHEAQKTFTLNFDVLKAFHPKHVEKGNVIKPQTDEELSGYSTDLSDITDSHE